MLYDIDKPGGFKDKVITATACVKPAGSEQLDDGRVSAIRHLVAGAIAGLKPQNVTVSDLNGRTWYGNPEDGGDAGNNLYISLKRVYEQDFKAKILNSLGFIPNVTVAVNVELDHERIIRTKQFKRALDAASQQEPANSGRVRDIDSQSGRATTSAQRPNVATALDVLWGSPRGGNEAMEVDDGLVGSRVQVEKESVGPTPIWVRVSVWVPVAYFKKIWQEATASAEPNQASRTPDPAALKQFCADESAKIQRLVAQLLPPTDGETDAIKRVAVTTFQDIPAQEPLAPTFGQNALNWASQSWAHLSMIGLALVSLLVLRSMVRSAPSSKARRGNLSAMACPMTTSATNTPSRRMAGSHGHSTRPADRRARTSPRWSNKTRRRPSTSLTTGSDMGARR